MGGSSGSRVNPAKQLGNAPPQRGGWRIIRAPPWSAAVPSEPLVNNHGFLSTETTPLQASCAGVGGLGAGVILGECVHIYAENTSVRDH